MKKILVTEDEGQTRRSLAIVLESAGFYVRQASNGREAMEILMSEEEIDLLLTDIFMPVMTGMELIGKVRQSFRLLPIIVVTGYRDRNLSEQLEDLRCTQVIDKPFEPELLLDFVGRVLKDKEQ